MNSPIESRSGCDATSTATTDSSIVQRACRAASSLARVFMPRSSVGLPTPAKALSRVRPVSPSDRPLPAAPGRYRLRLPDGRVRLVKVFGMNGELYAVNGWLGLVATPAGEVAGQWLLTGEALA